MSTLNNYITVAVADGTSMNVYVAIPKQGSGPFSAIMVFQEAFGVTSHIRSIADRLAAQGYVAVAPELFHRTAAPGFEGSYTDFPSIMPHYSALTTETMEADIKATYDWLQQQTTVIKDKIGSIGFCMGGKVSMIANMVLPLSAAISYYGSLTQPLIDRLPELHAPQLLFWGGLDKHILHEHTEAIVKELKSANKEFINVDISYADHGFNCDDRVNYNPKAAKEAWAMSLAFLENNLRS
jgi:carboxymethylenebutenolidase